MFLHVDSQFFQNHLLNKWPIFLHPSVAPRLACTGSPRTLGFESIPRMGGTIPGPVPACCVRNAPPSSFPDLSEGFLDLTVPYSSSVDSMDSSIPWGFMRLQWINGFTGEGGKKVFGGCGCGPVVNPASAPSVPRPPKMKTLYHFPIHSPP